MNGDLYDRMLSQLKLAGYQERSWKSYLRAVRQLQNFHSKDLEHITEEDIQDYWVYCKDELEWRPSTMRISYSGIKFFFVNTLKRDWDTLRLIKVEAEKRLPVILSIDEVRRILAAIPAPQNRAFFTLVYSCGLRLQEAMHVQTGDVAGDRGLLHVQRGKGAKDRYVPLPEVTLHILRDYWKTHRNPTWLFPALGRDSKGGPTADRPVRKETIQGALRRTVVRLGIKKHVTPHVFRHSYASHLIEANVPIRHVQEYLGHSTLASTMIYVHVTSIAEGDSRQKINQLMRGILS